jgi:hypothetical protein
LPPVLALAILSVALPVAVPREIPVSNLMRNGSFASDVSLWKTSPDDPNPESGSLAWSRRDGEGSKASGSLELVTSATADRNTLRVGQCVRLDTRVENLVFGGRIRVPSDQAPRGVANLEVERFESADCSGKPAAYEGLGGITNADFWSSRRELVATAGARSIRLVALVTKYYEWREDDEIGETDDDVPFRAAFDDLYLAVVENGSPGERPPLPLDPRRFTAAKAAPKKARWGPHVVDPPTLSLSVLGPDQRPHKEGVVPECSSLDSLAVDVTLKNPYPEEDPRTYPLQPASIAGEGVLGPRATIELGLFRAGDKEHKLVPISCEYGPPVGLRVLGDRNQRIASLREFFGCLGDPTFAEMRKGLPEKPSDDEILGWPLARWVVANPAGEYEIVARYQALEAGFWHEPVLSNTVKVKVVRNEPCPKPPGAGSR